MFDQAKYVQGPDFDLKQFQATKRHLYLGWAVTKEDGEGP